MCILIFSIVHVQLIKLLKKVNCFEIVVLMIMSNNLVCNANDMDKQVKEHVLMYFDEMMKMKFVHILDNKDQQLLMSLLTKMLFHFVQSFLLEIMKTFFHLIVLI